MKLEEVIGLGDFYKAVPKTEVAKRAWKTRKYGGSHKELERTLQEHLNRATTELKEEFGAFVVEPSHGGNAALLIFKDGAKALAYMSGKTKADRLLVDTEWSEKTYKPNPPITLGGKETI